MPLSAPAPPPPHPIDETLQRVEERCLERLWALHESRAFPGLSAALVLPDGEVLSLPVGYADREAEREMAPDDLLLSGSVGKTYVTAALHNALLNTHPSELALECLAGEYLGQEPWFERLANAEAITVRHLLRHESGLARYVFKPEFFAACLADRDREWRPEELLAHVFDDPPLFPAGEGWAYSDTNYVVLGMILERVTGRPFYAYVQEHLLAPLELTETRPSDRREIPGLTQGYAVATRGMGMPERLLEDGVFAYNPQFEWCGGGFASSARDLARWARSLYRGEALEGDYLATMLDAVPSNLGPGATYGLGVMVRETPRGTMLGHDGFMTGYTATMGYFPEHGIAVALQLNTDDPAALGMPLPALATELVGIAVEELARERAEK